MTLQFGGGDLNLKGGSDTLLSGEFVYNLPDLEPEIRYDVRGNRGELSLRHKAKTIRWDRATKQVRNEWQIQLGNDIPLDLKADVGASTGELNLDGLHITNLDLTAGAADMIVRFDELNPERLTSIKVHSGAAKLDLIGLGNANMEAFEFDGGLGTYTFDFGGKWQRSASAHIEAGASRVLLRVPRDIGVRVCPDDLRSGDYGGLKQRGDCYVNSIYDQSGIQLDVSLDLGLGKLTIKQVN
jgi:hypothetical protein